MEAVIKAGVGLVGDEFEVKPNLCIWVRDGFIESIERNTCPRNYIGGGNMLALPQPANSHVHSADYIRPEYGVLLGLDELVKPPHGLKHRILSSSSIGDLTESTMKFYMNAWRMGTGLLLDFRELGGVGCMSARHALERIPSGMDLIILGRPGPRWPKGCDGLGISSPLDYNDEELGMLAGMWRIAMTHIAETFESRTLGDFEQAINYDFTAFIHGVYLSGEDLHIMAERGIGIVLCLRSNLWHGIGVPPLREVIDSGVRVGIGTDNAAWFPPNIWEEARILLYYLRHIGVKDPVKWIMDALFKGGYIIAGVKPRLIVEGGEAHMLLFNIMYDNIWLAENMLYYILKRVDPKEIQYRIDGVNIVDMRSSSLTEASIN